MLLAPSLTFGLKVTGLGFGSGGVGGWVEADVPGCEAVPADGLVGVPPHAARMVASRTTPAAPASVRILLVGINVLLSDLVQRGRRTD